MREDDSFQIRGSELKEKLSLMGYEIDPGLIRYIPIGNQGYCRREGMLKDGKVEEAVNPVPVKAGLCHREQQRRSQGEQAEQHS